MLLGTALAIAGGALAVVAIMMYRAPAETVEYDPLLVGLVGLGLALFGCVVYGRFRKVWRCTACGAVVERA